MKNLLSWRSMLAVITLLAIVFMFGCEQASPVDNTGELTIALLTDQEGDNRAIGPVGDAPLDLVSFSVSGTGPSNQSLEKTTSDNQTITIGSLVLGEWVFTGTGYNGQGKAISQGATTAKITGNNNVVTITLASAVGFGSFLLECTWNPKQTSTDSVVSMRLLDSENIEVDSLTFNQNLALGSAALSGSNIPAGFYTALVTIKTGDELVAGFVETVRIIEGTESSAICVLDIGHVVDEASITIIDNTAAPVSGSIVVTPTSLTLGQSATLTFALDQGQDVALEDLFIQWYCDGVPLAGANAASYTINSLSGGAYRYDIVVSLPQTGSVGSAGIRIDVPVTPELVDPTT